jgi:hypothetical protein
MGLLKELISGGKGIIILSCVYYNLPGPLVRQIRPAGQKRGQLFMLALKQRQDGVLLRLANTLSALYPDESEEKRMVGAMLPAASR